MRIDKIMDYDGIRDLMKEAARRSRHCGDAFSAMLASYCKDALGYADMMHEMFELGDPEKDGLFKVIPDEEAGDEPFADADYGIDELPDLMCLKGDFSIESLSGMLTATMILHATLVEDDMEADEAFETVKDMLSGYLMFTMYNDLAELGMRADIVMNEFGDGLCLVSGEGSERIVYDVRLALDKAIATLHFYEEDGKFHVDCDVDCFVEALMEV
ncbi:hypothetical protein SAMN02910456_02600 [Ruminococcaceae bacterium YRB3002]|nr:hypothetical protein SAMN02910456_02600 [Ruminococcaceae bacterium YRB3002]